MLQRWFVHALLLGCMLRSETKEGHWKCGAVMCVGVCLVTRAVAGVHGGAAVIYNRHSVIVYMHVCVCFRVHVSVVCVCCCCLDNC